MSRVEDVLDELDRLEGEYRERQQAVKAVPGRPPAVEPAGYKGPITTTITMSADERRFFRLLAKRLGLTMSQFVTIATNKLVLRLLEQHPEIEDLQWMVPQLRLIDEKATALMKERL